MLALFRQNRLPTVRGPAMTWIFPFRCGAVSFVENVRVIVRQLFTRFDVANRLDPDPPIIDQKVERLVGLAGELTAELIRNRIEYVIGDSVEGYNPVHDLCRLVINAAVTKAGHLGYSIENFEVSLMGNAKLDDANTQVRIAVDEPTLARKLGAAQNYSELTIEIDRVLALQGNDSIRTECFRRVSGDFVYDFGDRRPYYEEYGEKQVAAGCYEKVLRFRQHLQPLAAALNRFSVGEE